jgi:hypothetical protein
MTPRARSQEVVREQTTGLFADHGYEGTSIEAVLTAAGVRRVMGTLLARVAGALNRLAF